MHDKLELLLSDGVIEEVLGALKSGKEADLWIVRHAGEIVAAKIYKDRTDRSFHNNAAYKEGRAVRNSRTQRAIERGSRFGKEAAEQEWKSAEANALYALHARGVQTPRPVMFYEGVLLMELVRDAQGQPAPRLIDAPLTAEEAGAIYRHLRGQVVRMLCADLIHGDLSPYNVLLGVAGPTIIDFPQVVGAAHNSRAEPFFQRDLENLRSHLASYDRRLHGCAGDAREIWRAYVRRDLAPDFVPSGREPPAQQHPTRQVPSGPRDRVRRDSGRGSPASRGPGRQAGGGGGPRGSKPKSSPDKGVVVEHVVRPIGSPVGNRNPGGSGQKGVAPGARGGHKRGSNLGPSR
jgi:RIO kinase 1